MKRLLTFLFLIGCAQLQAQDYTSNVALLNDTHDRGRFLLSVYHLNQDTRSYLDSVLYNTGFGSAAHTYALDSSAQVDSILSSQIDQYLVTFGYPDREDFSETLRITPWLILSQSQYHELKYKHFDRLYKAYENGDLEQRRLITILEQQYREQFQKEYQSYAIEDKLLEELMDELDLKKSRTGFLKNFR